MKEINMSLAAPRVLFAIRNPEAKRQPGLAKAIQVARALGASLDLFHAITDTLSAHEPSAPSSSSPRHTAASARAPGSFI
jgi:hypothetical protein